jgi:small subunit ribosomal protein S3
MGQKVHPVGLRIGVNKDWNSRWYADKKDYSTYLLEDISVRDFFKKELKDVEISHVEIERTKKDAKTIVTAKVFTAKPGLIIGQEGAKINELTKKLGKVVKTGEARIEVCEVKNPNLDATLVALNIAKQLENRASFRIAQKKAIKEVRRAGALGVKTEVSGRLGGADIARSEGYKEGILSLHTLRADIDYAHAEARTTYGRLGVKVWICRGINEPKAKKNTKEGE